jgi:PilZ domain-containing protein
MENAVSPESDLDATPAAPVPTGKERREYFRIEDKLILRYRVVPRDAVGNAPAERHFDNSDVFELLRELRHIDHEHNNVLRSLAEQNRELGLYLKNVNRKIELVANALASLDQAQQGQTPQSVSISESGLAFVVDPHLEVGATVALELILLPLHTGLALYGEVVMSRDEQPSRTVVTFLRLRESERQILAKHILHVQIAAKRQQQNPE